MSQENVEVVRSAVRALDARRLGLGARSCLTTTVKQSSARSWFPEAAAYRAGHEALRAWIGFTEAFETFAIEVEQIVDAGEQVIVLARLQGRGRASGADVNARTGAIFTLRDAKIVRYALTDRREALEAVGLRE